MTLKRALLVLASTFALCVAAIATSPLRAGADEPSASSVEILPEETEPPPAQYDFTRDGWFVQAQGIYALERFGETGNFRTGGVDVDNTFGFNIEAGYGVAG